MYDNFDIVSIIGQDYWCYPGLQIRVTSCKKQSNNMRKNAKYISKDIFCILYIFRRIYFVDPNVMRWYSFLGGVL